MAGEYDGRQATFDEKVERFAQVFEKQQRDRIRRDHPGLIGTSDTYRSNVTRAAKYTRVDFNGSGHYMVDNATGEIFGIKGYGRIHRGHRYGTLDTIGEWDWSGYYAAPAVSR